MLNEVLDSLNKLITKCESGNNITITEDAYLKALEMKIQVIQLLTF